MIENYLLEELVTFAKYGTVAKTAEVFHEKARRRFRRYFIH